MTHKPGITWQICHFGDLSIGGDLSPGYGMYYLPDSLIIFHLSSTLVKINLVRARVTSPWVPWIMVTTTSKKV